MYILGNDETERGVKQKNNICRPIARAARKEVEVTKRSKNTGFNVERNAIWITMSSVLQFMQLQC